MGCSVKHPNLMEWSRSGELFSILFCPNDNEFLFLAPPAERQRSFSNAELYVRPSSINFSPTTDSNLTMLTIFHFWLTFDMNWVK